MYILGILISTLLRMHYYNCYNEHFIGCLQGKSTVALQFLQLEKFFFRHNEKQL